MINNFPKLRPILSAINTYGWAKFFVPRLKCFTMNEYTLKDSFEFTENITIDELFKSEMTVSGLNRKEMFEMLSLTLKESIILFDNKYYSEIDEVAMGSPLGPILANIFLCYHESNWLKDCPKDFKPVYYKRYVMIFLFCLINHNMRNFFLNI